MRLLSVKFYVKLQMLSFRPFNMHCTVFMYLSRRHFNVLIVNDSALTVFGYSLSENIQLG